MATRYTEAYSKGVHDHDASRVLRTLVEMKASIGLLRFHTRARALAAFYWKQCANKKDKPLMSSRLQGFGAICGLFPETPVQQQYVVDLQRMMQDFVRESQLFPESFVEEAAQYLFAELTVGSDFAVSRIAADLYDSFWNHLKANDYVDRLQDSLKAVKREPASCLLLARDWVSAFLPRQTTPTCPRSHR